MRDIGPNAKQAVFPLLKPGWLRVNGEVYEDGAYLAHWWSLDLPESVYITREMVGSDLTITWHDWGGLVIEAYREVELVLTA